MVIKSTQTGNPAASTVQRTELKPVPYDPSLDPECLLNTAEHAALRGCSASTIRRERNERIGVPFIAMNHNVVRYRRGDIIDFIHSFKKVSVRNSDIEPLCGPGPKKARRPGKKSERVEAQS